MNAFEDYWYIFIGIIIGILLLIILSKSRPIFPAKCTLGNRINEDINTNKELPKFILNQNNNKLEELMELALHDERKFDIKYNELNELDQELIMNYLRPNSIRKYKKSEEERKIEKRKTIEGLIEESQNPETVVIEQSKAVLTKCCYFAVELCLGLAILCLIIYFHHTYIK